MLYYFFCFCNRNAFTTFTDNQGQKTKLIPDTEQDKRLETVWMDGRKMQQRWYVKFIFCFIAAPSGYHFELQLISKNGFKFIKTFKTLQK